MSENRKDFGPVISVKECAALLGISTQSVYNYASQSSRAKKKIIPSFRIGGSIRFRTDSVLAWVSELEKSQSGTA